MRVSYATCNFTLKVALSSPSNKLVSKVAHLVDVMTLHQPHPSVPRTVSTTPLVAPRIVKGPEEKHLDLGFFYSLPLQGPRSLSGRYRCRSFASPLQF